MTEHAHATIAPRFGEIYWSTPAATSPSDTTTYLLAAGTTTLQTSPAAVDFSMPSNGRLRYDGADTRRFLIGFAGSMTTENGSVVVHFRIAKGGTAIASSEVERKQGTVPGDVAAFAVQAIVELATDDYVELFLVNETSSTDVTISLGNLTAIGFL